MSAGHSPALLVGIDTEGDNQWSADARRDQRFDNIYALPRLHAIFRRHGVRPTYVITYPVAKDPASARKDDGARGINKKDQRKAAAEAREKSQELRRRARQAEAELEKLTVQRSAVDQAMFDPKSAEAALARLTMTDLMKRRADLEVRIAAAEAAWVEASEALEAVAA